MVDAAIVVILIVIFFKVLGSMVIYYAMINIPGRHDLINLQMAQFESCATGRWDNNRFWHKKEHTHTHNIASNYSKK